MSRNEITLFAMLLLVSLSACGEDQPETPVPASTGRLADVQSWVFQLQGIDLDALAATSADLVVIDYANNDGQPFTRQQIADLQAGGKIVLSYLSIGEAETYRPYWDDSWIEAGDECAADLTDSAPDWLEPVNPEWCGNYPVQFWQARWQEIVLDYLDAIVAAGFDGVYLDKVDTFYYWIGEEDLGASFDNPDAAVQMADFVALIAAHARQTNPDFIVVPQNAPEIVEYLDAAQRAAYLELIDGIGVEDTFFYPIGGEEAGEDAPYNPQGYVLDLLAEFQAAGVPVFAIDYLTDPDKIEQFFAEALARGFIPYAARRELDTIGIIGGQ